MTRIKTEAQIVRIEVVPHGQQNIRTVVLTHTVFDTEGDPQPFCVGQQLIQHGADPFDMLFPGDRRIGAIVARVKSHGIQFQTCRQFHGGAETGGEERAQFFKRTVQIVGHGIGRVDITESQAFCRQFLLDRFQKCRSIHDHPDQGGGENDMFRPADCQFVQIDRTGLVVQGLKFHIIRDRCRCCHVEMPFLFAVNGIIYHAPDGKTSPLPFFYVHRGNFFPISGN